MQDTATQILTIVVDRLVRDGLVDEDKGREFVDNHVMAFANQGNGFGRWIKKYFTKDDGNTNYWVVVEIPSFVDDTKILSETKLSNIEEK